MVVEDIYLSHGRVHRSDDLNRSYRKHESQRAAIAYLQINGKTYKKSGKVVKKKSSRALKNKDKRQKYGYVLDVDNQRPKSDNRLDIGTQRRDLAVRRNATTPCGFEDYKLRRNASFPVFEIEVKKKVVSNEASVKPAAKKKSLPVFEIKEGKISASNKEYIIVADCYENKEDSDVVEKAKDQSGALNDFRGPRIEHRNSKSFIDNSAKLDTEDSPEETEKELGLLGEQISSLDHQLERMLKADKRRHRMIEKLKALGSHLHAPKKDDQFSLDETEASTSHTSKNDTKSKLVSTLNSADQSTSSQSLHRSSSVSSRSSIYDKTNLRSDHKNKNKKISFNLIKQDLKRDETKSDIKNLESDKPKSDRTDITSNKTKAELGSDKPKSRRTESKRGKTKTDETELKPKKINSKSEKAILKRDDEHSMKHESDNDGSVTYTDDLPPALSVTYDITPISSSMARVEAHYYSKDKKLEKISRVFLRDIGSAKNDMTPIAKAMIQESVQLKAADDNSSKAILKKLDWNTTESQGGVEATLPTLSQREIKGTPPTWGKEEEKYRKMLASHIRKVKNSRRPSRKYRRRKVTVTDEEEDSVSAENWPSESEAEDDPVEKVSESFESDDFVLLGTPSAEDSAEWGVDPLNSRGGGTSNSKPKADNYSTMSGSESSRIILRPDVEKDVNNDAMCTVM